MKHINTYKIFEATDEEAVMADHHLEIIKDIIHDVIDEYSIVFRNGDTPGLSYYIGKRRYGEDKNYNAKTMKWSHTNDIILQLSLSGQKHIKSIDFNNVVNSLKKLLKRLESLGYIIYDNNHDSALDPDAVLDAGWTPSKVKKLRIQEEKYFKSVSYTIDYSKA